MDKTIKNQIKRSFAASFTIASTAALFQQEMQCLIDREKSELKKLKVSEEKINELTDKFYKEAICQLTLGNTEYVINELKKYKNQLK